MEIFALIGKAVALSTVGVVLIVAPAIIGALLSDSRKDDGKAAFVGLAITRTAWLAAIAALAVAGFVSLASN